MLFQPNKRATAAIVVRATTSTSHQEQYRQRRHTTTSLNVVMSEFVVNERWKNDVVAADVATRDVARILIWGLSKHYGVYYKIVLYRLLLVMGYGCRRRLFYREAAKFSFS